MVLSVATLKSKDVIRLCDGKSLGCVSDIRFDGCNGCVLALCVLVDDKSLFCFGGEEIVVPWSKIHCIGEDVILVNIKEEECHTESKKRKKR